MTKQPKGMSGDLTLCWSINAQADLLRLGLALLMVPGANSGVYEAAKKK